MEKAFIYYWLMPCLVHVQYKLLHKKQVSEEKNRAISCRKIPFKQRKLKK